MQAIRADDTPMFVFFVEGMVNSRIAGAVTRAVRALDMGAKIRTDPVTQRLDVEPSSSDSEDIVEILGVAGFTATLTESAADSAFAWVDSRYSTGTDSLAASSGIALVDLNVIPLGTRGVNGVTGVSGSINLLPPQALGPLEQ